MMRRRPWNELLLLGFTLFRGAAAFSQYNPPATPAPEEGAEAAVFAREAAAMAIIFAGVALVKRYSRPLSSRAALASSDVSSDASGEASNGRLSGRDR